MNIHISEPLPWSERAALPNVPGVYQIWKDGEVVYIGRTWGLEGLRGRLAGFHRSATTGQKAHSGGQTYFATYGAIDPAYITVRYHVPMVLLRTAEVLNTYILYVERRWIWEHVERVGTLPACNSE